MHIYKIALTNFKGEIDFYPGVNIKYQYEKYQIDGGGSIDNINKQIAKVTVKATTFDEFMSVNNINKIDFIKMDTEATEDKVLEGALQTIKRDKPIIICEVLYNMIEEKIEKIVREIDYNIYEIRNNKLFKIDFH